MSVVAIKVYTDVINIVADSIGVWGDTKTINEEKLRRLSPDLIVGYTGQSSIGTLMWNFLNCPLVNTENGWLKVAMDFRSHCEASGLNMFENSFLIIYKGKAWRMNGLHVSQIKPGQFDAIGAGRAYALTALYLGYSAKVAVETACGLCTQCALPVVSMETPSE